jgi:hypothetical protein
MASNMSCPICHSCHACEKRYDNHLYPQSLKSLVKAALPWFNVLIPSRLDKLKAISSPKVFKGKVLICKTCGHGALMHPPGPAAIRKYYEEEYWQDFRGKKKDALDAQTGVDYAQDQRANSQISLIRNYLDTRHIRKTLEIGAGPAFASQLMRADSESLADACVCEPGSSWDHYYLARGLRKIADFFPLDFDTEERFDYIHTSHWLEHVLDLSPTISALHDILEEGGYLFVEVPNTSQLYWNLPIGDTPHIHFFTVESLKQVFEAHQFRLVHINTYGLPLGARQGTPEQPAAQAPTPDGVWIRAIFQKPEQRAAS